MFNPVSGIYGGVVIDNAVYAFGKWKVAMKSGLPKVNNFLSPFQLLVRGLLSATITADGPYDMGNMPLECGGGYNFKLGFTNAVFLEVFALVESIDPSNDVEDASRVSITAQSSGAFTAFLQ